MISHMTLKTAFETVAGWIGVRRILAHPALVAAMVNRRIRQTGAFAIMISGIAGQRAMINIAIILTVGRIAGTDDSGRATVVDIAVDHTLTSDGMISGIAGEFARISVAVRRGVLRRRTNTACRTTAVVKIVPHTHIAFFMEACMTDEAAGCSITGCIGICRFRAGGAASTTGQRIKIVCADVSAGVETAVA